MAGTPTAAIMAMAPVDGLGAESLVDISVLGVAQISGEETSVAMLECEGSVVSTKGARPLGPGAVGDTDEVEEGNAFASRDAGAADS